MAITPAMVDSFKGEVLGAQHNFTTSTGHTFTMALYTQAAASLDKTTTVYTATGELVTGNGYSRPGKDLTIAASSPSSDTVAGWADFVDVEWTSSTITADGCMIYNNTHASDACVSVHTFTSASSTNGTFTVQFPDPNSTSAIIRIG